MAKNKILVVDDEPNIVELVKFNLEKEGYQVITAENGREAIQKSGTELPDLIVLDIMLPEVDGFEVCRTLQKADNTKDIPIVMLTAKGEELDKILGLEMGADDYMTKPFSPRELVARVKARLRRHSSKADKEKNDKVIQIGEVVINSDKYSVFVKGIRQDLTPKEFELLRILAQNPGRVLTRDYLLETIWGYDYIGDSRTVDVHIRHIRMKLEGDSDQPKYIETIRGVGYKFKD